MKQLFKLKTAIKMAFLTVGIPFLFIYYILTGDNKLILALLNDLKNDFKKFKRYE